MSIVSNGEVGVDPIENIPPIRVFMVEGKSPALLEPAVTAGLTRSRRTLNPDNSVFELEVFSARISSSPRGFAVPS